MFLCNKLIHKAIVNTLITGHVAILLSYWVFYIHSMGGVTKCSRNTIFFSSAYTGWGSYIMHEKHDRTAESHAGVLGQKKNFFSSFTYTGWGEVILCLRNTIEQLNHKLGFLDRRRRSFFLLLHTQDRGEINRRRNLKHD